MKFNYTVLHCRVALLYRLQRDLAYSLYCSVRVNSISSWSFELYVDIVYRRPCRAACLKKR